MPLTFKDEAEFEQALVTLLHDTKGWDDDVIRYPSEQDLVDNWARILFLNNNDSEHLNGCPLTNTEMRQVLDHVNVARTPAAINRIINGRTITIKRDNPLDTEHFGKQVSLRIYSREEIAGGSSRYQIAVQPRFKARKRVLPSRRGDVMLLINGMPVIHIELKRNSVDVSHAIVQIEKYSREGVFATGIFSMVQVFVAMNPSETVYFANPGHDNLTMDGHFNRKFMFHWADEANNPRNSWNEIADDLLSIPMAHMLIGFYTVPDTGDGILKVMRSYQYYAASAIFDKVSKTEWGIKHPIGGYVWHTTGSGKTLTSFKAAQLLSASNLVQKVVFLVDRRELATQSLAEYRNFAADDETVNETENTSALFNLLTGPYRSQKLIVTSIQKLSNADQEKDFVTQEQVDAINKKRMVIIVDECHRDTFGDMMAAIKATFPYALLIGFTGTPIYKENTKKSDLTTLDVFGPELHRYVLADGIRDENVLGFDPVQVRVYEDMDLREKVALERAKASTQAEALADPKKKRVYLKYMNDVPMVDAEYDGKTVHGIEHFVPRSQWTTIDYQTAVVKDICKKWPVVSLGGTFHAMFATSSIPEAIQYYHLLKKEMPSLKVCALFDPNIDNTDGYAVKSDALVEILEDYEHRYHKQYALAQFDSYKKDLTNRLAHKGDYKKVHLKPNEQVDLVIVVDQLLTGFDSKWLNALFLDKLLRWERVIQAFSRTNRVFGSEKKFGSIHYYRMPHTMETNIKRAVGLYSGDRPVELFVQKLGKNLEDANALFAQIENLFESCGIEGFARIPTSDGDCAMFAKLFKMLSDKIEAARVQGFDWAIRTYGKEYNVEPKVTLAFDRNAYLVLAQRYKELFSGAGGPMGEDVPFEIDTHLTSIDTTRIDAKYMEGKFVRWCKSLDQKDVTEEERQQFLDDLHKEFAKLSRDEQLLAEVIIHDIQGGDLQIKPGRTFRDYLARYQRNREDDRVNVLVEAFGIDRGMLAQILARRTASADPNSHGRLDNLRATIDVNKAKDFFERIMGESWKPRIVRMRANALVTDYVTKGEFDVAEEARRRFG